MINIYRVGAYSRFVKAHTGHDAERVSGGRSALSSHFLVDDNGLVSPAKILDCNQFTWNWSTCAIHRDNPCACKPVGPAFSSPSRVRDTTFEAKFSENDWRQIIRSSAVSPRKLLRTPRRPSLRSTFYLTCMPFLASTSNNFFNVCVCICWSMFDRERERCMLWSMS